MRGARGNVPARLFDEVDLATVEGGLSGMRDLTEAEIALVLASREALARRRQLQALVVRASRCEDPLDALLVLREMSAQEEPPGGLQLAASLCKEVIPVARFGIITPLTCALMHAGTRPGNNSSASGQVLTGSRDGTVRLWRLGGKEGPVVLGRLSGAVTSLARGTYGFRFLGVSSNGELAIIETERGAIVGMYVELSHGIRHASYPLDASDSSWKILAVRADLACVTDSLYALRHLPERRRYTPEPVDEFSRLFGPPDSGAATARRFAADDPEWTARKQQTPGVVFCPDVLDEVTTSSFSRDGALVVTGSTDGRAVVWRADGTGTPMLLDGHTDAITDARFSRDGARVVTASRDGTARIWRVDGSAPSEVLQGHTQEVTSAAFSPDGVVVITASLDGSIRAWSDGKSEVVLSGAAEIVSDAEHGEHFLVRFLDGTVRMRLDGRGRQRDAMLLTNEADAVDLSRDRVLDGHTGAVRCAAWDEDGGEVVTAGDDGTARVWKEYRSDVRVVLPGQWGILDVVAPHPLHSCIAVASDERVLVFTGSRPLVFEGHERRVTSLTWSADGTRVVSASVDGTARIWNLVGEHVVLRGHTDAVMSAAFSPDGARVVSASRDGTARVWMSDGSGEPLVLAGHTAAVSSAAFSPDGKAVVTASEDGSAMVWLIDGSRPPIVLAGVTDSKTGAVLGGHTDSVLRAEFGGMGEFVLTLSRDGTARKWYRHPEAFLQGVLKYSSDVLCEQQGVTRDVASSVGNHFNPPVVSAGNLFDPPVLSIDYPYDSESIVAVAQDSLLRFERGKARAGHTRPITRVCVSSDGQRVLTASEDGTARLWDTYGDSAIVMRGHAGAVTSAAFMANGTHIVTGGSDGTVRVWRADGHGPGLVLHNRDDVYWARDPEFARDGTRVVNCWRAIFSPQGTHILKLSPAGAPRLWRADGGGDPLVLSVPRENEDKEKERADAATFSPDGSQVAVVYSSGRIRLWRTDGVGAPVILESTRDPEYCQLGLYDFRRGVLGFSADGQSVVLASKEEICARSADGTGEPMSPPRYGEPKCFAISADGSHVAYVRGDGLHVWRADGTSTPVQVEFHGAALSRCVEFSPDGTLVAVALLGSVRVCRADGTGAIREYYHPNGTVNSLVFSPDSQRLVTTSDEGTAVVTRIDGTAEPLVLSGHTAAVMNAAFSPDGTQIVTASLDCTARLWRADGTGTPIVFDGHAKPVVSAVFSPDGTRVLTSSEDDTARVWFASWPAFVEHARTLTTATLSERQRQLLLGETEEEARERFEHFERAFGRMA